MSTIPSSGPLQDLSRGHLQSSAKIPYSADTPSLSGSDVSLHRIKNLPGYTTPIFKGKEEQRAKVQDNVAAKVRTSAPDVPSRALNLIFFFVTLQGFIPRELVANEVQWFYAHLGIDDTYFRNESVEVISDHIIALFGAKVLAYTKHDPSKLVIDLEKIDNEGNGATFIHTSPPGRTSTEGPGSHVEPR
jgi:glutamate dehydrogenase